jgi:1-deoxy-D-xylulose-5-phosphate synthase
MLYDNGVNRIDVKRMGVDDRFIEHGPQHVLRSKYRLDAMAIINAACSLVGTTSSIQDVEQAQGHRS